MGMLPPRGTAIAGNDQETNGFLKMMQEHTTQKLFEAEQVAKLWETKYRREVLITNSLLKTKKALQEKVDKLDTQLMRQREDSKKTIKARDELQETVLCLLEQNEQLYFSPLPGPGYLESKTEWQDNAESINKMFNP